MLISQELVEIAQIPCLIRVVVALHAFEGDKLPKLFSHDAMEMDYVAHD